MRTVRKCCFIFSERSRFDKDKNAILSAIGMAFFCLSVHKPITVEKGELPSVCLFISMRYIFAALRRKNLSLMNKFSLNMHFCL